ncbi:hypothetical protein D3C75_1215440 [compost metagenome]
MSQERTAKALRNDWPMSKTIEVLPSLLTTLLRTRVMLWVTPLTVRVRVGLPVTKVWPSLNPSAMTKLPPPRNVSPKAK